MTFLHHATEMPFAQDNIILDREADHRIANNLGLIVSLLRLRARNVAQHQGKMERAEVSLLLEDIAARVETVAGLHRMLSHSYRNALVDLAAYLRELCTSLTRSLSANAPVECSHHADEACLLPPDQVLTVGMLVSELITNSVKYAHPTGLPVKIDITCRSTAPGKLVVEIADDGIGLPENFNPSVDGGLGLRVVRSLAAQLGAVLQFRSNALGTTVRLELPLSFAEAAE
jgi:two-component sensor histidine kinase